MKKFIIHISHTEYADIKVNAANEQEAEKTVFKNIDSANWGNNETEILDVEEI
ncbi:hypothetical protein KAS41_02790 [Candidatus Parcubacteria bacterium]|nr:hypothetical protein [Candidatus Parcubacteria bacterium]